MILHIDLDGRWGRGSKPGNGAIIRWIVCRIPDINDRDLMCSCNGTVIGSIRTEYEMTFFISHPDRRSFIFWKYDNFVKRQRCTLVSQHPFCCHRRDVPALRNIVNATQSNDDKCCTDCNKESG